MDKPRLVYTKHAEDMLVERDIDREWVEAAVNLPDFAEPDPSRPNVIRAFRKIAEHDNRVLRVVYAADGDVLRVITIFFDRGRSR